MKVLMTICSLVTVTSFAQVRPYPPPQNYDLESRVRVLEERNLLLERRLSRVELIVDGGNVPPPSPVVVEVVCTVSNSYNSTVYEGLGANNVDAGYTARKSCEAASSFASYCSSAPTCEPVFQYQQPVTCTVENSYNSKIYRATGKNRLDAKFKAQLACNQESSFASYCSGNAKVVCSQ